MAQHKMVTFRLHRTAVVFIVVGAVLAAVFIFAGGYLMGLRSCAVAELRGPARPRTSETPPPRNPATPQPRNPTEPLALRVGIFASEDEAKAFAQQLAARKLAATIVPLSASGVTLYTVQVGQYDSRAAAAAAAKELTEEHGLQPAVVPAGAGSLKD